MVDTLATITESAYRLLDTDTTHDDDDLLLLDTFCRSLR